MRGKPTKRLSQVDRVLRAIQRGARTEQEIRRSARIPVLFFQPYMNRLRERGLITGSPSPASGLGPLKLTREGRSWEP